jgi:TolB-like protein/Flp pilus assembly protein TadD
MIFVYHDGWSNMDNVTTKERPTLTARQAEIVPLLAQGASNQAIAESLGISVNTVKVHLAAIYKTLDSCNRTEAVLKAQNTCPSLAPASEKSVLAVLPFEVSQPSAQSNYLAASIAESLVSRIASWNWFPVLSIESSFQRMSRVGSFLRLQQELGARYTVTGSLHSHGPQMRILMRLTNTGNGQTLWAKAFEFTATDPLSTQERIARYIVASLMPELLKAEYSRGGEIRSLDSWGATMRGLHHLQKNRPEACEEACLFFTHALGQNPHDALAHYGLARAHYTLLIEQWSQADAQHRNLIIQHADRAMHHDPQSAFSLYANALSYILQGNGNAAIQSLRNAVAANPDYSKSYSFLGQLLTLSGRPDEGMGYLQESQHLSSGTPDHAENTAMISMVYFVQADYLTAAQRCQESIRLGTRSNIVQAILVASFAMQNDIPGMQKAVRQLRAQQPTFSLQTLAPILRAVSPVQRDIFVNAMHKAGFV